MFIEVSNNNGIKYLRLVESKRAFTKEGKATCKKVLIYNIGRLDKLDDGKPDFVIRLKESFKNGNPLIAALKPFVDRTPSREHYDIHIQEGDPDCFGLVKGFGNALIERIMEEIGINSFVTRYKQFTNVEFDLLGFVRLLIYGRILNPASKIATANQNNDYYSDIIKNMYEYNIYDTLSFISDYKKSLINWVNNKLIAKFRRNTDIIYYDVTNFFFEIEEPDDDDGLRKFGVSKEQRKQPLVQMGLFMDKNGLPISIETFPGNTLDHLTMQKALKSTIDSLHMDRFIFVGDRGLYRGDNTYYLTNQNHGYIISKSIEKTKQEEKDWILDDTDYIRLNNNFKYKSRIVKRQVKVADDLKTISEKVVVYFSKKFYDKQINENKSFLAFIHKLEMNPDSFRLSKTQSSSIKRFLKKDVINYHNGEMLDSNKLKPLIDFDKINKYKKSFGYYQIVTSELKMDDLEVIDTYHGLSKIEDQFRVMKSDLEARPMYVRTKEHITAHLVVCLLSLIILRIIQTKIVNYQNINSSKQWEMGLSGHRIQKALNKWTVSEITNGLYRFNDIGDVDLKLILDAFNISIPIKLYKKMELLSLKTSIQIV